MDLQLRKQIWSFPRRRQTGTEREFLSMSKRRTPADELDSFKGFRWVECYVDVAVNPVTKSQVALTPPVKIGCFEDFAKFYDQWDDFCENVLTGDPDEVCFSLQ